MFKKQIMLCIMKVEYGPVGVRIVARSCYYVIVSCVTSYHRPILIQLKEISYYCLIPFRFKTDFDIIHKSRSVWIVVSPIYIWEKKIKSTKK
jgi:hypothetical protein